MNPVPASFKIPPVARVNLLPPEVGQRRERKRTRGLWIFGLTVLVIGLAGAYVWATLQVGAAEEQAEQEQLRTTQLQGEIAALTEVDQIKSRITNAESARMFVAANEVYWPLLLATVDGAVPEGVTVREVTHSLTPMGQTPTGAASPMDIAGVGSMRVTLVVPANIDAATIQERFDGVPMFTRTYVLDARQDNEGGGAESTDPDAEIVTRYVLQLEVTLSYDILMQRFSPRWFGTDDESVKSLEEYYRDYAQRIADGKPGPTDYPPMPEATIPKFVPGQSGLPPAPPAQETEEAATAGEGA